MSFLTFPGSAAEHQRTQSGFSFLFAAPLAALAAFSLVMLTTASVAVAQPVKLPATISQALARAKVPADAVSIMVAPLPAPPGTVSRLPELRNPSGEANPQPAPQAAPGARLTWRSDVPVNPASVMKLVTTYAGLDLLGPAHFWRTRVYTDGPVRDGVLQGNLIIRGSGDPKLVVERLDDLIRHIMEKGVREVRGDVLLDNSVFTLSAHDPATFDDEPSRAYNVSPDGLLVNFKALVFRFTPDPMNQRALVQTQPPIAGVDIPTSVPLGRGGCGDWRGQLNGNFTDPLRVAFAGSYPAACGEKEWAVAYADPGNFAARVFEAMWRNAGGRLTGQLRQARLPLGARPLVTGLSLPLASVIADINKYSNNVMAQQLFLTLSSAENQRGSFKESRNRLALWWRERFGMRAAPVVENGSGLSRNERITVASLTALLQRAAADPNSGTFISSLSVAGVDGTGAAMRARNPNSPAIGNARLKTGTLRDVVAIAGYATGRSGQPYSVVAIINHANAGNARPVLDRVLDWAVQD